MKGNTVAGRMSGVLCAFAVVLLAVSAARAENFAVPAGGTLAQVIAKANELGDVPSEVVVSPGEYAVDACLTVSSPVTVRSSTGDPRDVKVYTTANVPIFYLTNAGATLSGLCVSNGYGLAATQLGGNVSMPNGGTVTNCWIAHGRGGEGYTGAIYMRNGLVTRSKVFNNDGGSKTPGIYTEGNDSVIEHCEIYGNFYATTTSSGMNGSAVQMSGGTVRYCVMTNNMCAPPSFRVGAGAVSATANTTYPTFLIDHCLIAGTVCGGGTSGGSALNLNIHNTQASYCYVRNCTIVGNSSMFLPAVIGHAKLCFENTIVWGNRRGVEDATKPADIGSITTLVASKQLNNCFPTARGTVCITSDPCFVDPAHGDYRLSKNSPCIGAGTNGCDIGCFAYVPTAFECGIGCAGITPTAARTGSFTAMARGTDATDVTFSWKVNGGAWTEYSAEAAATLDLATGRNTVHLRAKNGAGAVVEGEREVIVAPETVYLSKTSTPAEPYDDPAIAANDLKAALAFCAAGTTLVVDDGDYGVDGEAVIDQDITIRSVNGPAKTSIYRIGPQDDSARQCRVMRVRTAGTVLSGLTLSNGCYSVTKMADSASCLILNGATMTNCVMTGNLMKSLAYGGGAVWSNGGKIHGSIIENNTGGGGYGGGLRQFGTNPLIIDSIVRNHTEGSGSTCGGGIYAEAGTIERCVISNNLAGASAHGGGIYCGGAIRVENTLIANCRGVTYSGRGGGAISVQVKGGTFVNCTFADCKSNTGGGINFVNSCSATVVNCVFAGCESTGAGLGGSPDYVGGENSTFVNCCFSTAGQVAGEGGFYWRETDKLFADQPHGDYMLAKGSVLIDKGTDYAWLHELDLALTNRVMGVLPDIGAYEYPPPAELSVTYEVAGLDRVGQDITFTAKPTPPGITGLQFRWKLVNQADPDSAEWTDWSELPVYVLAAGTLGCFTMTVEAKNDAGKTVAYDNDGAVMKTPCPLMFLAPRDAEGVAAAFPYATRTTAATNIADLLPYVANGTEIVALKGRHVLAEGSVFNGATKFHGEGARDETVFCSADGAKGFCCFVMDAPGCEFSDVTVSNASAKAIQISDGSVSNCLFVGCAPGGSANATVQLVRSTMRNCTITGCRSINTSSVSASALYMQGDSSLAEDCVITDNTGSGHNTIGVVWMDGGRLSRTIVAGNRMTSHSGDNDDDNTAGVLLWGNCSLDNCLVCNNTTDGYNSGLLRRNTTGTGIAIVNCTIVSNTAALGPGGVRFSGSDYAVTNTLIYGNLCSADSTKNNVGYSGTCKVTLSHCVADNLDVTDPQLTIVQDGCFYADPKFRNFAGGNYQIKGTGPCRDAGADIDWPADAKDLRGNGRVKFSHVDIGCYECQTAGMLLLVR